MNRLAVLLAAALAAIAAPALADPLPRPEAVAQPQERPLLPRFVEAMSLGQGGPAEAHQGFSALLAKLPQPTPFRGLVQFFRASALAADKRGTEAADAVLESIRLLPEYSAPLLLASHLYAFSDQPGRATDYLLRATRIDPHIVNSVDDYQVGNLLMRLGEVKDRERAVALSERLLEVGWSKGSFRNISSMAMNVLEARLERGDPHGAAAMVPKIMSPPAFARLLTQDKFERLRPAVEAWAGPRLEKQWPIYLDQARAEWEASRDPAAGSSYASALESAGHNATLVATFLPLFDRPIDPARQSHLVFVAPPLTKALATLGRWDEAFAVLDKAAVAWPEGSSAQALNLSSNRGRLLFLKGNFAAAVSQLDRDLENVAKWGTEVNQGAFALMHLYRACALEQMGRSADAATSSTIVATRKAVAPTQFVYLQLCRNDLGWAKATLLQALEVEELRADVIGWMQPLDEKTHDSDFARTMHGRARRLRTDPALVAAANEHGTILKEPINATAPVEKPVSAAEQL